jgi:hypothetical protein
MSTTALKIFYIPNGVGKEDYLFATPAMVPAISAKLTSDGHVVVRVEAI